jgi:hypothetical protein
MVSQASPVVSTLNLSFVFKRCASSLRLAGALEIRAHAKRVGMPGDDFYSVVTTVVVRADPIETKSA